MALAFQSALTLLQKEIYRETLDLQPDVDEKGIEDAADFQQQEDMIAGAIMKGTIAEGSGDEPSANDLVFLHLRIGKGEKYKWSTRSEDGGRGHPQPYVLGKAKDLLKGVELAVRGMKRGERAVLEIKPSYAYQHQTWTRDVPAGIRKDDTVKVDVELVDIVSARKFRTVQTVEDTYKIAVQAGEDWETPRVPYRVTLHVKAFTPSTSDTPLHASQLHFSTPESSPLEATLGANELPTGLDAAVHTMVRGERCIVSCPCEAAAGGALLPGLRPDAHGRVEFVVELVDFTQVRDLTGNGQVVKVILKKGDGVFPVDCPVEDSCIRAHYRVRKKGLGSDWVFDTRAGGTQDPIVFDTGMATVPDAVDMGVRLMLGGEVALVTSTWRHSYDKRSDVPRGISEGDVLEFEVELVDFDRDKIRDDTDTSTRLAVAAKWKEQGNDLYKKEHLKLAKAKYLKASKVVERTSGFQDEKTYKASQTLQISCYLNLALCAQKQGEAAEAIHYSNKALETDSNNVKALFRRAAALSLIGEFAAAREDLQHALELDNTVEQDVKRESARLSALEKTQIAKQRQGFGKFFK